MKMSILQLKNSEHEVAHEEQFFVVLTLNGLNLNVESLPLSFK